MTGLSLTSLSSKTPHILTLISLRIERHSFKPTLISLRIQFLILIEQIIYSWYNLNNQLVGLTRFLLIYSKDQNQKKVHSLLINCLNMSLKAAQNSCRTGIPTCKLYFTNKQTGPTVSSYSFTRQRDPSEPDGGIRLWKMSLPCGNTRW